MPDNPTDPDKKLKIHINPETEYKYRDLFNIHISAEEVIIELGNLQRGEKPQGAIKDIIVMSPANALRLQQALGQSIETMQQKIREFQSKENHN